MKPTFLDSKDFWAGLLFIGIGATAMFVARGYQLGSTLRMGPGYFPSMLGGILIVFGISILIKGLRGSSEKILGNWSIRALIVLPLSVGLFGLLINRVGFVPALAVLIFGSAAAGKEFKLVEVLLLTGGLTVLALCVFIWGLGLPYPLFLKNF
jgi:hypothetical protein